MASNFAFFNYHTYNEKKIQFKRANQTEISGEKYYFVPMRYKNQEIYVKTPKIMVPFGLNIYETESGDKSYYYVLSFSDADIDPNIDNFYHFLLKIEDFCKKIVEENLQKWGCDYPFDGLSFKSCFKDSDGTPLFRLKINVTGKNKTDLFDETGKSQKIEEVGLFVTQRCQAISLIELNNIWINSTEYGVTWKVHQMRVYPSTRPIGGVSLLDENVELHTIKIVTKEKEQYNEVTIPEAPLAPLAPDAPIFEEHKIPRGGVAMLPFLSAITSSSFALKKVDPNDINKKPLRPKNDLMPIISLSEILNIRHNLKKSINHLSSDL